MGEYMFRLIMALGVAAVLLPAETITDKKQAETVKVSTYDTFNAAHSLYSDVLSFCDRNEETCITGKAIATNMVHTIRGSLNQFTQEGNIVKISPEIDVIRTSTVTK